jgi:hypothetical protein
MSNGRTLVVIRVGSGSIIAALTDSALVGIGAGLAVIAAINTLAEFVKNLKKWFEYAKTHKGKKRRYRKRKKFPGQRSVEVIIKAASRVSLKYEPAEGEALEVELTPAEVIGARAQPPADDVKKARREPIKRIPHSAPEIQGAIKQLEKVDAQNLSPTEVHAVVDVIVAVLEATGAGHHLPQIALELEMRGFHSIAHALRQVMAERAVNNQQKTTL